MNGTNTQPQHRRTRRRRMSRMTSIGEQIFLRHPLFGYSAFVGISLLLLGSVAVASLPA
jgi:hypothetical protein